jgi:hypothetical protein
MAKPPSQPRRPRNPVAMSPLLRKGGAHERPKGGERQLVKRATDRLTDGAWLDPEAEQDAFDAQGRKMGVRHTVVPTRRRP